jgi:radical SAM superfamily enzyme YgiQ (UPF0313 family)
MNVILLNTGPAASKFSLFRTLGAYKIAHAVRQQRYSCQVIDFVGFMTEEVLLRCVLKFITNETEILGLSTTFMADNKVMPEHIINVINYLTNEYPNLKIVFGGYHGYVAIDSGKLQTSSCAIIIEYGEDTFVELLNFYRGNGTEPTFKLYFKSGNAYPVYSGPTVAKYNIETDNHLFTDQDCILPNETLPIEISRGCIFKCKFCNHLMLGRKKLDYLRDMELIKDELIHNYEKWGTTNYFVICDTFNDTEYKMQLWHKMVTSLPFKINYTAYLRADLLHRYPDVPHMLQESGLLAAYHGIESLGPGSQVVGKGWSQKSAREYIPELYHNIWNKEIYQTCSFIVGLPGDTRETWIETMDWFEANDLHHLAPHVLGLWKAPSKDKNRSEFEMNSAKYGYRFPNKDIASFWQNDYWNAHEAYNFLTACQPRIKNISARFGSWVILLLLQYGLNKNEFSKQHQKLITKEFLENAGELHLEMYVNKLLTN